MALKLRANSALFLGAVSLVCGALLAFGQARTQEPITARLAEDLQNSLSQVIPPEVHDNDLLANTLTLLVDGQPTTFYRGMKEGTVSAVAFQMVGQGYGGPILILMGLDRTGSVLGVRVIQHSETPGLGDKIERGKSDWVLGFNHHSLADLGPGGWQVRKDGGVFDQFTGATITPRAVVTALRRGLKLFGAERETLLDPDATGEKKP